MFSKLKSINVTLLLILIVQVWWLVAETPVQAQTTPFLKRPYYGPAMSVNAMFDHWCPDYAEALQLTSGCSVDLFYTINGQYSNGINRMLRYDGNVYPPCTVAGSNCYSGHSGTDFGIAYRPVVAAAPGEIKYAGWNWPNHDAGYGLMVTIEHSNNHQTVYGHLSMVRYAPPWQVGNWQIGTSGTTGNSDGPHLHFEVRYRVNNEWQPKDPYGRPPVDPWQNYSAVVSEWLWVDEPARTQTPPPYNGDYILDNDDSNLPTYFTLACNAGFGAANCPFWWYVNNNGYWGDLRYTKTNGNTIS